MTQEQPKCPACSLPVESCECEERVRKFREERYKGLEVVEKREIQIDGHKIEIVNYNPNFRITEQHLKELQEALNDLWQIDPEMVKTYNQITLLKEILPDIKQTKRFSHNGNTVNLGEKLGLPGLMGKNIIEINERGTKLDLPHRIDAVSNWKGTLIHEFSHCAGFQFNDRDFKFMVAWMKKFGWDAFSEHYLKFEKDRASGKEKAEFDEEKLKRDGWQKSPEGWQRSVEGWQNGKYVVERGDQEFTSQPERCVTEYAACVSSADDMAESFVAYLYKPEVLDPEKRQMIDEWVKKKKAERSSPELSTN